MAIPSNDTDRIEKALSGAQIYRFRNAHLFDEFDSRGLSERLAGHICSSYEDAAKVGIVMTGGESALGFSRPRYGKPYNTVATLVALARMGGYDTVKYVVATSNRRDAETLLDAGCSLCYNLATDCGRWSGLFEKAGGRECRPWIHPDAANDTFLEALQYALARECVQDFYRTSDSFDNVPEQVYKMTLGNIEMAEVSADLVERASIYWEVLGHSISFPHELAEASLAGSERGAIWEKTRQSRAVWLRCAERLCIGMAYFDFSRDMADVEQAASVLGADIAIDALFAGVPIDVIEF